MSIEEYEQANPLARPGSKEQFFGRELVIYWMKSKSITTLQPYWAYATRKHFDLAFPGQKTVEPLTLKRGGQTAEHVHLTYEHISFKL